MEQAWTARIASGSPQHTARAHQRALPCLDNVENSDITRVTTLVRGGRSRGGGTRTHDLLVPNQARYRLRYAPRYSGTPQVGHCWNRLDILLSLIHISEPTRLGM